MPINCRSSFLMVTVVQLIACLLPQSCWSAPGQVDGSWSSIEFAGEFITVAARPDQRIWVGGNFTYPGLSANTGLLPLLPHGFLDNAFFTPLRGPVSTVKLLPSGETLFGPSITLSLQRLRTDGKSDTSFFQPSGQNSHVIGLRQDETYLVPGRRSSQGIDVALMKLSDTGLATAGFAADFEATILTISVLSDDSCYAGGKDSNGLGVLARISASGIREQGFAPAFDGPVQALTIQPDGKILAGGKFGGVNGSPRKGLARLLPDGTTDPFFNVDLGGPSDVEIKTLLPQTDGAVLISGNFTSVNGMPRPGMARLASNGDLDPTFTFPDPDRYGQTVKLLGMLPDGRVFADAPGSAGKRKIILLQNSPGSSSLELTGSDQITWNRSGAVPALNMAHFEKKEAGAAEWTGLGPGVRTPTGWTLSVPDLPATGSIRAFGWGPAASGESAGSLIVETLPLGVPAPDLWLQRRDTPATAQSIGSLSFYSGWRGSPISIPLAMRNRGRSPLSGITLSITGAKAASFALINPPGSVIGPGATAEFAVAFNSLPNGDAGAILEIRSNDPDQPSLSVSLGGYGSTQNSASFDSWFSPALRAEGIDLAGLPIPSLSFNTSYPPFPAGQDLMLINNVSQLPINGILAGMPQGTWQEFTTNLGIRLYQVDYFGGDGNDLVLHPVNYGKVDPDFRVLFDETVQINACIPLRKGGWLVGGQFKSVNRQARSQIARLFPDGRLDQSFQPSLPPNDILSISELEDGKILLGQSGVDGRLIRLLPDGTTDPGFQCQLNQWPDSVLPLPDGRILITGRFTQVNTIPRNYIARLNPDGSLDTTFDASSNNMIHCSLLMPDGKFLVGGRFTEFNGTAQSGMVRLNTDGSLDPTLPKVLGEVSCFARQQNSRILCASYGTVARLLETGAKDISFTTVSLDSLAAVRCLIPQANGKVFGGFLLKNEVFRLSPNGALDFTFLSPLDPSLPRADVMGLCLTNNGSAMIGGDFYMAGGERRSGLIRVMLEPPVESLEVQDQTRIQWLRGGSLPDSGDISFALHVPLTNTWSPLGRGTSITGGWELTGLGLPPAGAIRATARISSGRNNSSFYFVDTIVPYGDAVPALKVSMPSGAEVQNGTGALDFGSLPQGAATALSLALENRGSGILGNWSLAITGAGAPDFAIGTAPQPEVTATGVTRVAVRFIPTSAGTKNALLTITSNSPDTPVFTIALQGTGTSGSINPTFADPGTPFIISEGFATAGRSLGRVTLAAPPVPGTLLTVVSNPAAIPINGVFGDVPPSGMVTAYYDNEPHLFQISYTEGNGQDIVLQKAAAGQPALGFTSRVASPTLPIPFYNHLLSLPDGRILHSRDQWYTYDNTTTFTKRNGDPLLELNLLDSSGQRLTSFSSSVLGNPGPFLATADDHFLIGGTFSKFNGSASLPLIRADATGRLDSSYGLSDTNGINSFCHLADDRLLIGGTFTQLRNSSDSTTLARPMLARLLPGGFPDPTFTANIGPAGSNVTTIAVQQDGRILISGTFTTIDGISRLRMARLLPDGALDPTFTANADNTVNALLPLYDGSILAAGSFQKIGNTSRPYLARLTADGTPSFVSGNQPLTPVTGLHLQADGKILVCGTMNLGGGILRSLVRLNPDGTVDPAYVVEPETAVTSFSPRADGSLAISGPFGNLGPFQRNGIAVLQNDPATELVIAPDNTQIVWLRGGSAPEVHSVTFESSTDQGLTWSTPMLPARIPNGWRQTGLSQPSSGLIRCRGRAGSGTLRSSSVLIESILPYQTAGDPLVAWRLQHFFTGVDSGPAANTADPDQDGLTNLAEYALGLVPTECSTANLPVPALQDGVMALRFNHPSSISNIHYTAESASDPAQVIWTRLEDSGTAPGHVFKLPVTGGRQFLRLRFDLK